MKPEDFIVGRTYVFAFGNLRINHLIFQGIRNEEWLIFNQIREGVMDERRWDFSFINYFTEKEINYMA